MKTTILSIFLAGILATGFSQQKIKFNPYQGEKTPPVLIYSILLKTGGFALMSIANHRQKQVLNYGANYKVDNQKIHSFGLGVCAVSLPLDGIFLIKKQK